MATQKIKIREATSKNGSNTKTIVLTKKQPIKSVNTKKQVVVISKKEKR